MPKVAWKPRLLQKENTQQAKQTGALPVIRLDQKEPQKDQDSEHVGRELNPQGCQLLLSVPGAFFAELKVERPL